MSDEGFDEREGDSDKAMMMPVVPAEIEVDPLLLALLHSAAFLDLSGEDSVDSQDAVDVLETVGHYIQRLPEERLEELQEQLDELAAHGKKAEWPPDFVEFVQDFLYNCGVGGDEDEEDEEDEEDKDEDEDAEEDEDDE
jgi:hypothetical protein